MPRAPQGREAVDLVIDKNVDALIALADRHVILEKGHVVWSGTSAALAADPAAKEHYLLV